MRSTETMVKLELIQEIAAELAKEMQPSVVPCWCDEITLQVDCECEWEREQWRIEERGESLLKLQKTVNETIPLLLESADKLTQHMMLSNFEEWDGKSPAIPRNFYEVK